jgi:hypothetical protein
MRKIMRIFLFSILMEHRWNEIDRGKPKYSERSLSQCPFVHHKSHMDRPGIDPGLRGERPATNSLSHGTAIIYFLLAQTIYSNQYIVKKFNKSINDLHAYLYLGCILARSDRVNDKTTIISTIETW